MNGVHEKPIVIQGALPTPMLGVLTTPADPIRPSGMGVLIVNGGAQYRAGAHRLFVQLARHLALQGHTVLRFDFPGQGDSPGEPVGFEDTAPHIAASIDALRQHQPDLNTLTLLGLCDGASASLLYLHANPDTRIHRLILLNPWVHNETLQAHAQVKHYYLQRLLMRDFWLKLIKGGVGMAALRELAGKLLQLRHAAPAGSGGDFQSRMARAWHAFEGRILLVLSGSDQTAQEFEQLVHTHEVWAAWNQHHGLEQLALPATDHTLSNERAQETMLTRTVAFLQR